MSEQCPLCESEAAKVIYLGLPMKICLDAECACLFGVFANVAAWMPIATESVDGEPGFAFTVYEGSYLAALWHWLTDGDADAAV